MIEDFQSFFSTALGKTRDPYRYQQELANKNWPDVLIAPTGLGKTAAVVLSWAWKHASPNITSPPRRLVYCLPMRTLVNQTHQNIREWLQKLTKANSDWKSRLPDPDDIYVLMGGENEGRWLEHPERTAILIGTQDMLISRALMRGYAMSRFQWPMAFALLHNDAQWVFDEVQLMGSGLATSTQLEGFRHKLGTEIPSHSLWVSATLHPSWLKTIDFNGKPEVWNVPDDFPADKKSSQVRKLINAPKHIKKSEVSLTGIAKKDLLSYAKDLASKVVSMHRKNQLTLVVLNTVARAQAVHAEIRKKGFSSDRLALIHSRFRPADRETQMEKLPEPGKEKDLIVVATQAIEAGVDFSSAVMWTEISPLSSFVQRLGRLNRYGELNSSGGGKIYWVDIASEVDKDIKELSAPYSPHEIESCKHRINHINNNVCTSNLPQPKPEDYVNQSVIRDKDIMDLYDTDPDLTGFDIDISQYIRDAEDTDVRVFWRDISNGWQNQPKPSQDELCAIPIGRCIVWLKKKKNVFYSDPQSLSSNNRPAWTSFREETPWPGLVLMLDKEIGGYATEIGFNPDSKTTVEPIFANNITTDHDDDETHDADKHSEQNNFIKLHHHLMHVTKEADSLCDSLSIKQDKKNISIAACWHDIGKAHEAFQERMSTDDEVSHPRPKCLLAKARKYDRRKGRSYFRHELASALAYLSQNNWSRDADLIAYLIASHHGKVRMNLRALPAEKPPKKTEEKNSKDYSDIPRFARGIWENDYIPQIKINNETLWKGGNLTLSVMELGEHSDTGSSWTERTQGLLLEYGPFRLAWLEAILRVADWKASKKEKTA